MEGIKPGDAKQPSLDPKEPAFQNAKKVGFLGGIEILGIRFKMAFKGEKEKDESAMTVAKQVLSLVKDDMYMESAVGKLNHMNNRQLAAFNALLDKDETPGLKDRVEKLFAAKNGKLEAHKNIPAMQNVKPLGFLKSIWHGVSNWRSVAVSMAEINAEKLDTNTEVGKMYKNLFNKTVPVGKTQSSSPAEGKPVEDKKEKVFKTFNLLWTSLSEDIRARYGKKPQERGETEETIVRLKQAIISGDWKNLNEYVQISELTKKYIGELHKMLVENEEMDEEEGRAFDAGAKTNVETALSRTEVAERIAENFTSELDNKQAFKDMPAESLLDIADVIVTGDTEPYQQSVNEMVLQAAKEFHETYVSANANKFDPVQLFQKIFIILEDASKEPAIATDKTSSAQPLTLTYIIETQPAKEAVAPRDAKPLDIEQASSKKTPKKRRTADELAAISAQAYTRNLGERRRKT